MSEILLLKITLDSTNPVIWRRVLVPASVSFFDLHHIIQICMGWRNSHLFEFQVNGNKIGYTDPGEALEDTANADDVTLELLITNAGITSEGIVFTYLYDFGDCWQHTVTVEAIHEREIGKLYPVCIDGQLACPPEDSGGIHSFYESLAILKDPNNAEYKRLIRWLGRAYDPDKFDIDKVNKELPKFRSYMSQWK